MTSQSSFFRAGASAALLALATALPGTLVAQSLEGSKWSIDQEGVDAPVLWWLGSQGRVRTGDIGTILPGYHWVQKQDSLIVSVGDTLRYAGVLMANRLVGVRTGPRRQEGWWSGARSDGAAAVAQAPTTPATPANDPSTQPLSRPADPAANAPTTPSSPAASNPPAGGRTLRRIEREGAATPASTPAPAAPAAGEGREIRRIPRPGQAAAAASAPASDAGEFVGRWDADDAAGTISWMEIRADGTFDFAMQSGSRYTGNLAMADGRRVARFTTPVGTIPFFIAKAGEVVILTGVGPAGNSFRYHRGGAAAAAPASAADFVGRWTSHNPNLRLQIEIGADSTFTFTSRNGERHPGRWVMEGAALVGEIDLTTEGTKPVLITREGEGIKLQARNSLLYILMDRAPAGSSLEPAVRQP